MLVPKFGLNQTAETVIIKIHSPYTNVDDTEIYVEGKDFVFSSPPYHLRLHLPGRLVENERSTAKYECELGDFTFTFEKENKGEDFPGLDMITSLMAPTEMKDVNPSLIEVINSTDSGILETEETDTTLPVNPSLLNNNFSYGFANKLAGSFKDMGSEFPNIFELKTPDEISYEDRKKLREENENNKFSSDHYLADFFDEELISPLMSYVAPWECWDSSKEVVFTDEEIDVLKDLPNKEYLLNKSEFDSVLCNLVDILFSYCYEKRTTYNENTVESSWTINRLSATLSWFETFANFSETMICCYRRALIYPMYRNFDLCNKVKNDVASMFRIGRKYVVKCLIEIYQLFNSSQDARYILNQLYMRDFLIFSQKCDDATYKYVSEKLVNLNLTKPCLNLELEEYEEAGNMVQVEESQILENAMALKMSSMKLTDGEKEICVPRHNNVHHGDLDTSDSSSDSSDSSSVSSSDLDSDDDDSSSTS